MASRHNPPKPIMMLRRNAKSARIGNSLCSTPDLSPLRPASPKGNKIEQSSNIKVVARFRPLNELEKVIYTQSLESSEIICNCIDDRTFTIDHGKEFESFTFDKVFAPDATQQEVFEFVGEPVIEDVLNGYNGTVFAYGQTGSGKTYTMMGVDIYDEEHRGIIPRAATQVFAAIETADRDVEFTFTCSMLEIYKETLKDLLEPSGKELKIKEDPRRGIYVAGLREVSVVSDDEMMQIINVGEQTRTVATTRMNRVSSRSHQLFMLQVRQKLPNDTEKRGILNLIDLAGSEKVNHSGVTGNKLEEAKKINLSLSALGNVIHALILKQEHIPYRDSKLTRLLQESLGGNYKTTLVVACSPSPRNLEESLNTIKFAQRAKTVKNNAKMNIKKSPEIYMKIIEQLKKQLLDAKSEISVLKEVTGYNEEDISKCITPAKLTKQYSERIMTSTRRMKRMSSATNSATNFKADFDDTKTLGSDESANEKRLNCSIFEPDSLTSSFLCDRKDTQETDRIDMSKCIDHEIIRSYVNKYEEKITQLEEENRFLKSEKESYEDKIADLEKKLFISRQKQLSSEQKSHEYYESYHKTLYLINKDASEAVLIKKQNTSLLKQVKKLTNQLQELDTKFRSFVNNVLEMKGSTQMEFDDRTEEFLEDCGTILTEEEEIDVDQSELNISNKPVNYLPLDTETLESSNSYSALVRSALEPNTVLKREMTIFHLRNQVIQAGFMNCNLTRIIHALEWRNSLYKHKYEIKRNVCRQQQAHIRSLEDMLDYLHDSYNHLIKLMEKQELDLLHKPSLVESQLSFSKAKIVRPVSSQNFRGGFVGRKNKSSKSVAPFKALTPVPAIQGQGSDSVVKGNSFMESEVDTYTVNKKLKFLEANLQIQKMYNIQIKQVLEENKDECARIKALLSTFETNVFQTQKEERDKWNSFLNEFKMNCEHELMRKHDEVVRLNTVLAEWIHKFMELQQKTGIPSSKGHKKSLSNQFMDELRKLYESTSAATSPMDSFLRIEENFRLSPIRSDIYYTPRISRTCIGDTDPILDID